MLRQPVTCGNTHSRAPTSAAPGWSARPPSASASAPSGEPPGSPASSRAPASAALGAPPPHPSHRPSWDPGSRTTRTGRLGRLTTSRHQRRRPPPPPRPPVRRARDDPPIPPTTRRLLTPPPQSDRRTTRRRRLPAPLHPFPNPTYTDGSPKREPGPAAPPRAAAEHTEPRLGGRTWPPLSDDSGADGQPRPAGDWAHLANVGALARTKTLPLYVLWQVPPPIYKQKRTPQAPRTCGATRRHHHPTAVFPWVFPAR